MLQFNFSLYFCAIKYFFPIEWFRLWNGALFFLACCQLSFTLCASQVADFDYRRLFAATAKSADCYSAPISPIFAFSQCDSEILKVDSSFIRDCVRIGLVGPKCCWFWFSFWLTLWWNREAKENRFLSPQYFDFDFFFFFFVIVVVVVVVVVILNFVLLQCEW